MNAIESALSGTAPSSPAGFRDGLGERVIVQGSVPGERLEILQLLSDLTRVSSFEFALRERTARLANFQHDSFARVRQIDRVRTPVDRLNVVSEHVDGWRLSDILAAAHERGLELDVNAALSLVSQLVRAVAALHQQARGVAHGAIALERLVITRGARLVVVEQVLGAALERLDMNRERLWRELRVAAPSAAGGVRFDHRADVTAIGVVALALLLGRPIGGDEYPQQVGELVAHAQENRGLGDRQPLSKPLRTWLMRALQLDLRNSFQSAVEAKSAFDAMMTEERSYVVGSVGLESFVSQYERTVSGSAADTRAATAPPVPATAPAKETRTPPSQATTTIADAQQAEDVATPPVESIETAAPVASSAQAPVSVSSRGIEEVHEALSPAVIPDSVAIGS
ncbi:MAG: hypothetical protein ACM3NQ_25490, partial [Bacteroidales bacterium]